MLYAVAAMILAPRRKKEIIKSRAVNSKRYSLKASLLWSACEAWKRLSLYLRLLPTFEGTRLGLFYMDL